MGQVSRCRSRMKDSPHWWNPTPAQRNENARWATSTWAVNWTQWTWDQRDVEGKAIGVKYASPTHEHLTVNLGSACIRQSWQQKSHEKIARCPLHSTERASNIPARQVPKWLPEKWGQPQMASSWCYTTSSKAFRHECVADEKVLVKLTWVGRVYTGPQQVSKWWLKPGI